MNMPAEIGLEVHPHLFEYQGTQFLEGLLALAKRNLQPEVRNIKLLE
jgi:hypothetical protein